jgi:hypothetical protein
LIIRDRDPEEFDLNQGYGHASGFSLPADDVLVDGARVTATEREQPFVRLAAAAFDAPSIPKRTSESGP